MKPEEKLSIGEHLVGRSRNDLIEMIKVLTSENPEQIALINSRDQKKAAGRIVAIQSLQRALSRVYRKLEAKHADVEDLLSNLSIKDRDSWIAKKKIENTILKNRNNYGIDGNQEKGSK